MTYYERLGIAKTATQNEIKEAYKNLVKRYHPDVYAGDKTYAEKMTQEINLAYEVLSNPEKKAEYDNEIEPKYTYTPPTYNYSYTPPKYDTPPSNYNDYRKTYSKSYDYNDRYTDYHRNKTPNSNYSETSPLENKIINLFDKDKMIFVFLIFIIYIAIFIFTFRQFYTYNQDEYTGTITNQKKVETEVKNEFVDTPVENTTVNPYSFPTNYEDFNINDYVSDSELYSIYSQYFYSQYETFDEFKEQVSKELFDYYSELY